MAFTANQPDQIKMMMDQFIEEYRPSVEIRPKLDKGWRMEKQSVYLFDIRPKWNNPKVYGHYDFAKATWIESQKLWKVYWKRANLKWDSYRPLPTTVNLKRFLIEAEKDPYGFFHG